MLNSALNLFKKSYFGDLYFLLKISLDDFGILE